MAAHILSSTTTVAKTTPNNISKAPKTPFLSKPPLVSFNKLPLLTPKPFMTFNKPFINFNKSFIPKAVVSQNNANNNDKDSVAEVEDGCRFTGKDKKSENLDLVVKNGLFVDTRSGQTEKSRVLIIGATGKLGYHLAKASANHKNPTFALVRKTAFSNDRKMKLDSLIDAGVELLAGSLEDEKSLDEALKKVNVVICAIPSEDVLAQKSLIHAIKRAGHIERFIPSEFGADPTKVQIPTGVDDKGFYSRKAEIRHLVEAEEIPYTFISCNFLMSYLLPSILQPGLKSLPRDTVEIFGNGDVKGLFVNEAHVADFTIRAVDDPDTVNKTMYLRPADNIKSMKEIVDDWEKKIEKDSKKLNRKTVSEKELLTRINDLAEFRKMANDLNIAYDQKKASDLEMQYVFIYSAFVKQDQTDFECASDEEDGTNLYERPERTTISDYLDTLERYFL